VKLPKLPENLKIPGAIKDLIPEIPAERTEKIKDGASAVRDFIYENLTVFIIGSVGIVIVLLLTVLFAMNFGGMKTRSVTITEISGEVKYIRDSRSFNAKKNAVLLSGDTITVADGGRVVLKIDPDKYITLEEDTALFIDYTDIEGRGAVSVNLLYGSVISRLDNPIREKDLFAVVTPNGTIQTKDAVFRTTFTYYEDYADGQPAKITDVEDFSGNLTLQLYDEFGEKSGSPMLQAERTTARLITTPSVAQYSGLNVALDLTLLRENTLSEILRITAYRKTAYETPELSNALKIVAAKGYPTETVPTIPTDINTEQIVITVSTTPTQQTQPTLSEIATETIAESTTEALQTVPTTAQTFGEFTEYTGEKWWLFTGTTAAETTAPEETTESALPAP
jgi:hypothetical protein